MELTVELYETPDGGPVVEAELEAIEGGTPVLYDLLAAGLNKLRRRDYHRPPLGRKDTARAAWFFHAGQRIIVVRCFVKKSRKTPRMELELAYKRMAEYLAR